MQKYELLLVLPGTLDEQEVAVRSGEIAALVGEYGANATVTNLGKNRLAYPIKQIRYGYFYTLVFEAEAEKVSALQKKLRLNREVLRAMITHFNAAVSPTQRFNEPMLSTFAAPSPAIAAAPRTQSVEDKVAALMKEPEEKAGAVSAAERKIDNLDIDVISKKLDDLMSGDVIPGV